METKYNLACYYLTNMSSFYIYIFFLLLNFIFFLFLYKRCNWETEVYRQTTLVEIIYFCRVIKALIESLVYPSD